MLSQSYVNQISQQSLIFLVDFELSFCLLVLKHFYFSSLDLRLKLLVLLVCKISFGKFEGNFMKPLFVILIGSINDLVSLTYLNLSIVVVTLGCKWSKLIRFGLNRPTLRSPTFTSLSSDEL